MTKFETIGVNYQYGSRDISEANKLFAHSCDCCCNKGIHIECDRCAIAHAHSMVCAYFADRQQKANESTEGRV